MQRWVARAARFEARSSGRSFARSARQSTRCAVCVVCCPPPLAESAAPLAGATDAIRGSGISRRGGARGVWRRACGARGETNAHSGRTTHPQPLRSSAHHHRRAPGRREPASCRRCVHGESPPPHAWRAAQAHTMGAGDAPIAFKSVEGRRRPGRRRVGALISLFLRSIARGCGFFWQL